jgi:hypothetical protein
MRFPNLLLAGSAGMLVVGLVGCSGSASAPSPYSGSPASSASSSLSRQAASSATAAPAPRGSAVPQAGPPEPETTGGARAAAAAFYRLYSADQFSAAWGLLSPTAKRAVPLAIWISVHNGCSSASGEMARVIKAVVVFGNAAIVTEKIMGTSSQPGEAEDVFNYISDRWAYTPDDPSVYQHGSVAADIASAKALGLCTGRTALLL